MNFKKSFTCLELSLAGVALTVLGAILIPVIIGPSDQTRLETAKSEIEEIRTALSSFEVDYGNFPNLECKSPQLLANRLCDPDGNSYLPALEEDNFIDFQYEAQNGGESFMLFVTATDKNQSRFKIDSDGITTLE